MKSLSQIKKASDDCECLKPEEAYSKKCELITKLEADGYQPISVGRSVFVIEQCEEGDEIPTEAKGWGTLRLSIYCDPDVYQDERPRYLYLQASRWGLLDLYVQERNEGTISKIFEMI